MTISDEEARRLAEAGIEKAIREIEEAKAHQAALNAREDRQREQEKSKPITDRKVNTEQATAEYIKWLRSG